MRVVVTGATGVLGVRAVQQLVEAGHDVTALARTPEKAKLVSDLGATPATASLFDVDALADLFAGHDAVANLATKIPPLSKAALPSSWSENERIRKDGSTAVTEAAMAAGVGTLLQESLGFAYADHGQEVVTESEPLEPPDGIDGVVAAERNVERFTASGGRGVALRFGNFIAADSDQAQSLLSAARKGVLPVLGANAAWWPYVHVDDAAAAVVAGLAVPAGAYNVAAEPIRRADLAALLARLLGRNKVRRPPAALAKVGPSAGQMLLRSIRLSSEALQDHGWERKFPTAEAIFHSLTEEPV